MTRRIEHSGQAYEIDSESIGSVILVKPVDQLRLFSFIDGLWILPDWARKPPRRKRPALAWSDRVEAQARRSGKFHGRKFHLRGEDLEDFVQDAVAHIYRKVKAGKFEYISAIDQSVKRLAIDLLSRKESRRIQADKFSELDDPVDAVAPTGGILLEQLIEWKPEFVWATQELEGGRNPADVLAELMDRWRAEAREKFDV